MASPPEFNRRMKRLATLVVANVDAGWRLTALAVDQAVVLATPVDTGRARSNWRVGTTPPTGVVDPYAPGAAGKTGSANAQAAIDQGKAAVAAARGNVLYISNNLPYIEALNNGSSAQAPAGFIELAVNAGVEQVRKIKALG